MVQTKHRYTDQEWLSLIQECRSSGMSDKQWLELKHIDRSVFYYHIRRLKKQACAIAENTRQSKRSQEVHEIVQISVDTPDVLQGEAVPEGSPSLPADRNTAVHLTIRGIPVDITNAADPLIIRSVLTALLGSC